MTKYILKNLEDLGMNSYREFKDLSFDGEATERYSRPIGRLKDQMKKGIVGLST